MTTDTRTKDGSGPRPQILLVDDEPDILFVMWMLLDDAGFDVT